ncbi:hypothetical protein J4Q44_G00165450 [Coregonus suidteri]|uniref:ubiquitinyl hydrolase 1 n=1 Tax=Coregonus suidteri TaxID=861788 RepID=A0AAN8LI92_9TELE
MKGTPGTRDQHRHLFFSILCQDRRTSIFFSIHPAATVPVKIGCSSEDRRSRHCPYLDTINRSVLDFDFEKLCSISLSHINVYACLICGKYFQVGLNNIKANDYANVVLQALSNVPPLRNYFLEEENYCGIRRPPGDIMVLLVQRFGELMRKLWNPRNFKAHVSPHEMLQAVVLCSKKNFQITK